LYYSKTTLIGKVVKPQNWEEVARLTTSVGGNNMATFMLSIRTKVGDFVQDDWHYVVVFDELAKSCSEHLKVGDDVLVEGRFKKRKPKPNGDDVERWEMIAEVVKFGDNVWDRKRQESDGGKLLYRSRSRSEEW